MNLRPLIIDEETKRTARKIILHAEQNVFQINDLVNIKNQKELCAGDREGFSCDIEIGYRVVYSLEQQKKLVRHISISVNEIHRLPGIAAIEQIIQLFGFTRPLEECLVRLEHTFDTQKAINVWEEIDETVNSASETNHAR